MRKPIWQLQFGDGPLVAAAIHDGDDVRDDLLPYLALSPTERLREQDPFTGMWTAIGTTRLLGLRSRFEIDLNRPREKAVYLSPDDAWGLEVWTRPPDAGQIEASLFAYDAFYDQVGRVLERLVARHGQIVVFDLHSYNHRRQGPDGPEADPAGNPEVNVGTGSMNRDRWGSIVDRFMKDLRTFDFFGRGLDVRENVKFQGG